MGRLNLGSPKFRVLIKLLNYYLNSGNSRQFCAANTSVSLVKLHCELTVNLFISWNRY